MPLPSCLPGGYIDVPIMSSLVGKCSTFQATFCGESDSIGDATETTSGWSCEVLNDGVTIRYSVPSNAPYGEFNNLEATDSAGTDIVFAHHLNAFEVTMPDGTAIPVLPIGSVSIVVPRGYIHPNEVDGVTGNCVHDSSFLVSSTAEMFVISVAGTAGILYSVSSLTGVYTQFFVGPPYDPPTGTTGPTHCCCP